jgi:hypothetical protein
MPLCGGIFSKQNNMAGFGVFANQMPLVKEREVRLFGVRFLTKKLRI